MCGGLSLVYKASFRIFLRAMLSIEVVYRVLAMWREFLILSRVTVAWVLGCVCMDFILISLSAKVK